MRSGIGNGFRRGQRLEYGRATTTAPSDAPQDMTALGGPRRDQDDEQQTGGTLILRRRMWDWASPDQEDILPGHVPVEFAGTASVTPIADVAVGDPVDEVKLVLEIED